MSNIWLKELYFEKREITNDAGETDYQRLGLGESDWYETFADNVQQLFRSLQKGFGGCVSKIYQDTPMGDGTYREYSLGWVFEKKVKYEDCNKYFIREVWCEISLVKPKGVRAA